MSYVQMIDGVYTVIEFEYTESSGDRYAERYAISSTVCARRGMCFGIVRVIGLDGPSDVGSDRPGAG